MSKRNLVVLIVGILLVGLVLVAPSLLNRKILPEVTQTNVEAEVINSDRPVVLLVTSGNCGTCKDVARALKAKGETDSSVKFMQIPSAVVGAPDQALPMVLVMLPGVPDPIYSRTQFNAGNLDALVTKIGEIEVLRKDLVAKNAPFDAQLADVEKRAQAALAPIQAELEAALAPFKQQAQEIQERAKTALGDLPEQLKNAKTLDEALKIQSEMMQKAQPFQAELAALQQKAADATKDIKERGAALVKPFQDEAAGIEANRAKELGDLQGKIQTAVGELEKL
jgi:DNA repair exonuclease SbcCD ATPase subunit